MQKTTGIYLSNLIDISNFDAVIIDRTEVKQTAQLMFKLEKETRGILFEVVDNVLRIEYEKNSAFIKSFGFLIKNQ